MIKKQIFGHSPLTLKVLICYNNNTGTVHIVNFWKIMHLFFSINVRKSLLTQLYMFTTIGVHIIIGGNGTARKMFI